MKSILQEGPPFSPSINLATKDVMGFLKKDQVKFSIKLLLGALLIFYVLRSKMIDFQMLRSVLMTPSNLFIALGFLSFGMLCCAMRWYLLVRVQGLSLSLKNLVELTMIGNFFNTFMPGAVGGDLIKAWYVAGQEPKQKTKAIFTVLLDRVIGLWVIVLNAAITLVIYSTWLDARTELRLLAYAVWAFSGGSLVIALAFFASGDWLIPKLKGWEAKLPALKRVFILLDSALLYRHHAVTMINAIALSALSFWGSMFFYKIQGDALGIPMDLSHYFFVVPIAVTISAVPILPGGIGVGQVAFFTLFQWSGVANAEQGGTLCTLVQIYTILFNCLGAFFYLRFKRRPSESLATSNLGKVAV